VAGLRWNWWPQSIGIDGRNGLETVAGIRRNQWPESFGIGGRISPEYADYGKLCCVFSYVARIEQFHCPFIPIKIKIPF
jgi:hypothetical protein